MNKISTRHIKLTITIAMLMFTGAAMAQRTGDPEPEPPVANTKVLVEGSVFGGGNLAAVGGNTSVIINQTGSQVETDVYGGGALADVGTNLSNTTTVTITNGKVIGDVYGGGLGDNTTPAMVNGNVAVVVGAGSVSVGGSVFGCNNVNGTPLGTVTVTINGSAESTGTGASKVYAIGGVYGGGNLAHYDPTTPDSYPTVTVNGCTTSIKDVYGGGNAAAVPYTNVTINGGDIDRVFAGGNGESGTPAHVGWKNTDLAPSTDSYGAGTALATIHGGTINQVFSGSNAKGVIRETMGVSVSKYGSCAIQVGELYGGGNMAPSQPGTITVGCMDENDMIDNLYGGANKANITGDIELNIETGRIGNVFGGNNTSGSISGSITVKIDKDDDASCAGNWYVGNVYGGGNQAPYTRTPDVNIINGTVSGSVYGGGNEAGVGGGDVVMTGGTVLGGIYGGCNSSGVVGGDITVTVEGGTIGTNATTRADVFGGGYGAGTSTTGNVTVNFGGTPESFPSDHNEYPKIFGDIYGGSALGSVNPTDGSKATTVNILNGTLVSNVDTGGSFPVYYGGNVFGGGLGLAGDATKGKVNGTVTVNIGSGTPHPSTPFIELPTDLSGNATIGGNVYGCNNSGGSPQDDVTVNVFQTAHTEQDQASYLENDRTYAIPNVFGGGNEANFSPAVSGKKTYVNIYTCNNTIGRVFGGGNAAATPEIITHIQGGRFSHVFGGGNGERGVQFGANVNGDVTLSLHGGNIGEYYGGSNQNGIISGTIRTNVLNDSPCEDVSIEEFFCGGKFEDVYNGIEFTMACSDSYVNSLYGGCNQANIYGNVILNLYGGTYTNVFGGSKGVANGISADIKKYPALNAPGNPADLNAWMSAHGGSSLEGTGGNVTINLFGGTIDNVYGGSNINGNIEGNIIVNVIDAESATCPLDVTNIYGGSNETDYTPTDSNADSPVVNVIHVKSGVHGNVYGGSRGVVGAGTKVVANPKVNIGYESTMTIPAGYTVPDSPKSTIQGSVFGGGDAAKVEGNTEINLNKHAKVIGNVYGGGNMGEVEGDTKVIVNGKRQ